MVSVANRPSHCSVQNWGNKLSYQRFFPRTDISKEPRRAKNDIFAYCNLPYSCMRNLPSSLSHSSDNLAKWVITQSLKTSILFPFNVIKQLYMYFLNAFHPQFLWLLNSKHFHRSLSVNTQCLTSISYIALWVLQLLSGCNVLKKMGAPLAYYIS